MTSGSQNKVKDQTDKVKKYTGEAEDTAQTSRNKKAEQMKGLKEKRSSKDNSPEKDNYQKPNSSSQHGEKSAKD